MEILITGGTGFVGACLARRLQRSNSVHLMIRPNANKWRLKSAEFEEHTVDLADKEAVASCIRKIKPDRVFHLASYGVYPTQKEIPKIYQSNITASTNLLQALDATGFESMVFTSSAFIYGFVNHPISETDPVLPPDVYSVSKAAVDSFLLHEAKSKKLPINVARLFLVYGPYEASTRLIPTLINSYMNHQSPQLSHRENVRDFVFVEDVVDALLALSESGLSGEAFNIGTGKEHTVEKIAEKVRLLLKSDIMPTWGVAETRSFEPRHWCADISKASKLLRWAPKRTLDQGLEHTADWYAQTRN